MSKLTADSAKQFLWAVEMVVNGIILPDLTSGLTLTPSERPSYEVALNIVQDTVKEDWVVDARAIWLNFCIERWHEFIKKWNDSGSTELMDYFDIEREIRVRLVMLDHYIQTRYVGKRRNAFIDDFIKVLKWVHEQQSDQVHFSNWIKQILKRRTCMERENDPHADPLSYSLLCKHFGVSE